MKITGRKLGRSRTFWSVLAVFLLANVFSLGRIARVTGPLAEQHTGGFPFPVYALGPDLPGQIFVYGVLLNLATALTAAVTAVWIARAARGAD